MKYFLTCFILIGFGFTAIQAELILPELVAIQIPNNESSATRDGLSAMVVEPKGSIGVYGTGKPTALANTGVLDLQFKSGEVNLADGSLTISHVDLAIPSTKGPAISISRTYSSRGY
ncbi:hypothetical protein EBR96_07620, partial [bacterium]|nr:hypothetical protein [bacterium]